MNAIEIKELRKQFAGKRMTKVDALKGLDLTITAGEVFGFLGPNGAGKTTTINMLCGLLRPDAAAGSCLGFDVLREAVLSLVAIKEALEDPARLLSLVFVRVQLPGLVHGIADGVLRQLVKQDPVKPATLFFEHLGRVPGNGLTFAVGVRRQVDIFGFGSGLFQGLDHFLLAGDACVLRCETGLDVDSHFSLGKVLDMAHRGGHVVVAAQEFLDRPDLGRGFYYH